jgi:hypothetical protein
MQGVVPVDPYAQHADGQQVLGGELIGSFGPVSASAKPLKVCARVLRPSRAVGTEIRLNQPGSEVFVAKLIWDVDTHDFFRSWTKAASTPQIAYGQAILGRKCPTGMIL